MLGQHDSDHDDRGHAERYHSDSDADFLKQALARCAANVFCMVGECVYLRLRQSSREARRRRGVVALVEGAVNAIPVGQTDALRHERERVAIPMHANVDAIS